jgi:hypothetical protein
MSQKTIKPKPAQPQGPLTVGGIPKELLEVPNVLKLSKQRGNDNYTLALQCLVRRFAESDYCKKSGKAPHQLLLESVHSLIHVLNEVFPRDKNNRPLGVPEVAFLFGAVVGHAAAPATVHGEAKMDDIDAQVEVFWISLREWLVKGYMAIKHIESTDALTRAKLGRFGGDN